MEKIAQIETTVNGETRIHSIGMVRPERMRVLILACLLLTGCAVPLEDDQEDGLNQGWCFTVELNEAVPHGFDYTEHDCEELP